MRWQLLILAVLPACSPWRAGTAYGVSSGDPDYWGHRPGPAGFGTVVVDAGHGGKDAGATAVIGGVKEKDLALDTARRLQRKLAGKVRVVMVRDDDRFVDLDQRVAMASNRRAAVLVSIHYNSGRSTLRGPETYYWRVDSHGLANRIQQRLARVSPSESGNRGQVRRRLRLTRNPNIPCVLVECGYLSHPAEARLCLDARYRDQVATAIAMAILDQQCRGDAGTGPLPQPINAPPSRPSDGPGS